MQVAYLQEQYRVPYYELHQNKAGTCLMHKKEN